MEIVPEIWEDCKTKEQKEAFIEELERIEREEEFTPMSEVLKEFGLTEKDL